MNNKKPRFFGIENYLIFNRKGDWTADSAPFMAIFVMVCGLLFLLFLVLVTTYAKDQYEIPAKVEDTILTGRLLQNCFVQEDKLTGISQPAIDWEKFNQAHLDSCYPILPNSKYYGFKLSLSINNTGEKKVVQTSNWQGRSQYTRVKTVQIWQREETIPGALSVEVQADE